MVHPYDLTLFRNKKRNEILVYHGWTLKILCYESCQSQNSTYNMISFIGNVQNRQVYTERKQINQWIPRVEELRTPYLIHYTFILLTKILCEWHKEIQGKKFTCFPTLFMSNCRGTPLGTFFTSDCSRFVKNEGTAVRVNRGFWVLLWKFKWN